MWIYARVLYFTSCNTCISTFIAPFGDTVRTFQAEFLNPDENAEELKKIYNKTKEHTVFNIKNPNNHTFIYFFFIKKTPRTYTYTWPILYHTPLPSVLMSRIDIGCDIKFIFSRSHMKIKNTN